MDGGDDDPPSSEDGLDTDRELTVPAALLWTLAALFVMMSALVVTQLMRPNRGEDIVNLQVCFTLGLAVAIYGIARVHLPTRTPGDLLGFRPVQPVLLVLAALTGGLMLIPASWVSGVIETYWPRPEAEVAARAAFYDLSSTFHKAVFATIAVAVGPVVEDLFFRGALFRGLRRSSGRWITVTVTAAAFALVHLDPRMLPIAFLGGVVLGYLRDATGSVVTSTVAHVAYNGAITFGILSGAVKDDAHAQVSHLVGVGGTAGMVFLLALAAVLSSRSEVTRAAREEDAR